MLIICSGKSVLLENYEICITKKNVERSNLHYGYHFLELVHYVA